MIDFNYPKRPIYYDEKDEEQPVDLKEQVVKGQKVWSAWEKTSVYVKTIGFADDPAELYGNVIYGTKDTSSDIDGKQSKTRGRAVT